LQLGFSHSCLVFLEHQGREVVPKGGADAISG
jgi:hypothetical protein